jgi:hypothetical protein
MMRGVRIARGLPRIVRHLGYQDTGCLGKHSVNNATRVGSRRKNCDPH